MDREEFIKKFAPDVHPTMCPLMFTHFSTETNGQIKFCCEARPNPDVDQVDGKSKKIIEIFNNEYYNTSRKKIINGERSPECSACWFKEKQGLTSKRLEEWDVFFQNGKSSLPNDFYQWSTFGTDLIPSYYNLQVAKTCNYACLMCSTDWSSLITSIGQKVGYEKRVMLMNQRWWTSKPSQEQLDKSNIFWEGLKDIVHKLEYLYVTGGEPFIIKPLWEFINFLVDTGYSKNVVFWCNTNTSQFTEHQIALLKKFKRVELNLSIDAYGDLNEYIRTSSNWDHIERNIDLVLPHLNKNFYLTLVPVVTGLNIRYLHELIYWWRNKVGEHNRCVINPIPLVAPRSMSTSVMPKKYVDETRQSLITAIQECKLDAPTDFKDVFNLLDNHEFSPRANTKLKEEFSYFNEAVNKDYFTKFKYLFE
jgi:organic radical activating enzyme